MRSHSLETDRLLLQQRLDTQKTQLERNRLGQFATPTGLAQDVVRYGLSLLEKGEEVRFLDPAFGTGSFFSALLEAAPTRAIKAVGYEIDPHYGMAAADLWEDTSLDLRLTDFTKAAPPGEESSRFNFLICNPPYVRHHHIDNREKGYLQRLSKARCGVNISGLAGLYCYFLCISRDWMQQGGIAGWLIPSEFMDVNYGKAIKEFLLNQVTLLRVHRFNPNDVQFEDALVSSAVVWFRNDLPARDQQVEFSYGGSLCSPQTNRLVSIASLKREPKWSRFPVAAAPKVTAAHTLADLFTVKRGIATGDNHFFVLPPEEIARHRLPHDCLRPILPSPRYIREDEIMADKDGAPILERRLYLIDCRLPEMAVMERYPTLWAYLEKGVGTVSEGYLCRHRKVWYYQEERVPAPIVCTYLGRSDAKNGKPFRFILNHSRAVAPNVYLLLYPKPWLGRLLDANPNLIRQIWRVLNQMAPESLAGEGRVYGGGLHKLEPRELGNVDASPILSVLPGLIEQDKATQPSLFDLSITE
jgi:hypothetical protein